MNTYEYFINCDERGDFHADVRPANSDETIWQTRGSVFEDGWMDHRHDMDGLTSYLVYLEVIPAGSRVIRAN